MSSASVEDKEKLYYEYQSEYMNFLQRQPELEMNRRKLLSDLAECHEMVSILNNPPPFDHPAVWNKAPLNPDDKKQVQVYVQQKLNELNNEYDFKLEDIENPAGDIQKEVKLYLD